MEYAGDRIEPMQESARGRTRNRKFLVLSLCILTAFFLWFLRALENTYTTTIERPLYVDGIPDKMAMDEPLAPMLRLRIEAPGHAILRSNLRIPRTPLSIEFDEIRPAMQRRSVDLVEAVPMARFINRFRGQVGDLTVLSVAPDTIRFRFKPIL